MRMTHAYGELGDKLRQQLERNGDRITRTSLLAIVNGRGLGHEVVKLYPDGGVALRIKLKKERGVARRLILRQFIRRNWLSHEAARAPETVIGTLSL
jgi:hypothetical protein